MRFDLKTVIMFKPRRVDPKFIRTPMSESPDLKEKEKEYGTKHDSILLRKTSTDSDFPPLPEWRPHRKTQGQIIPQQDNIRGENHPEPYTKGRRSVVLR